MYSLFVCNDLHFIDVSYYVDLTDWISTWPPCNENKSENSNRLRPCTMRATFGSGPLLGFLGRGTMLSRGKRRIGV